MFDYLIVGAGFAGSVLAERLATRLNKSVLLCDERTHIGGDAYDYKDEAGILVHRYGPQVFHTDSARIFQYLSQFTPWRPYQHRELTPEGGEPVARYTDRHQVMPLFGFTRMIETMLDHPKIRLLTGIHQRDIEADYRHLIYTGPIDAYFGHRHGKLPKRAIERRFETHDCERFQPVAVVTHPDGTRTTEFKHLTGQKHSRTTVMHEKAGPEPESAELHRKYEDLARATSNVRFIGGRANDEIDQVVGQALSCFEQIAGPTAESRAA